jgi:hypothetical protein
MGLYWDESGALVDDGGLPAGTVASPPNGLNFNDLSSTIATLGGGLTSAVTTGLQFMLARDNYQAQADQRALSRELNKANVEVQRVQGLTAAEIAKTRAAAQLNQERIAAGLGGDSGLGAAIFNRVNSLASGNSLMLWLTVAGVALAFMQYRRGR